MSKHILAAAVLAVALIAYNNLLNLWPAFHRLYIPINLTAVLALAATALGPLELEPSSIGLAGNGLADAAVGVAAGLTLTLPLYLALLSPQTSRWVADRRLADLSSSDVLRRIFLRVPLGTVLLEELAFRGVVLALLIPEGVPEAVIASSVVFGLWHVVPTLASARANGVASFPGLLGAVTGGVVISSVAGLIFAWLRLETEGLAAPIAMHAATNSSATLAGFLALRQPVKRQGTN